MQDSHFRLIKDAGFSSVRINLHPFKSVGPAPDHAISPNWMETFDWAVGQALANDLMVILDMHEYNTMGDDPMGNKGGFLATWRQLAPHCRDLPDSVPFEIRNEPCRELTPELWDRFLREAYAIVREADPGRALVFQGPDIGHLAWAGADVVQFCSDYAEDIISMHVKDIDPDVRKQGVAQAWDYGTFSRRGIFAELGEGFVDFPAVLEILEDVSYEGWVIVETDVTQKATPLESAVISRDYLKSIGL